jgi:uncharacterized protein with HEPN domain
MRDDRDRLIDILNAIDRILEKAPSERALFDRDEMLQVWVLHHLQVIGEAARALSDEFEPAIRTKSGRKPSGSGTSGSSLLRNRS